MTVVVLAKVIAARPGDKHIPLIQRIHAVLPENHHEIPLGGVICGNALAHRVQRVAQILLMKRRFLCHDLRENGFQVYIHKFLQAVRLALRGVRRQRIEGQVLRLIRCIGHHRAQGVQLKLAACPVVCGNLQWVLELEKIGHLRLRGVVLCEILKYLRCFGDPVSAVDQLLAVLQDPDTVDGHILPVNRPLRFAPEGNGDAFIRQHFPDRLSLSFGTHHFQVVIGFLRLVEGQTELLHGKIIVIEQVLVLVLIEPRASG